jgi:molybdenum cofactor guanylyltransferase
VEALANLAGYVASGRRSLRGFAAEIGFRVAEWPSEPIDPFFNVNTAEELAQAEAWLARRNADPAG